MRSLYTSNVHRSSFFGAIFARPDYLCRSTKKGVNLIYGYARVSTTEQETTLQLDALKRSGVEFIHQEKTSSIGKRPELQLLLAKLTANDSLVVYKLDRLARSLKDLMRIFDQLDKVKCSFRSLTEPIDTSSPVGRLMLGILGSVAEFERSLIRERSVAGQVAAVRRGQRIGRPRVLSVELQAEVLRLWQTGDYRIVELCRKFSVHDSVVRRVIYEVERPNHPWVMPNRPVIGPLLING